ncbi:hypothetical protein [Allorhodopirellula solitaria]|uniref:Uncharacterized protein n=1 Tax=Allorhodopirellula solitaria TaxID=2527987 RepID=A0A5C5YEX2_9BACT|nr:hypothetical protein [Allorhodopirellula solitaria]TWT73051.1 hypothetical protein CA85_15170 [Allorhodopirellula solitaria]
MKNHIKRIAYATAPFIALTSPASLLHADEPNDAGPRYEDDAWYDVSEWFDGNDYNPTDEAIGRWDNETFSVYEQRDGTDQDNDVESVSAEEFYGEDWDDGYGTYTDADEDGVYESFARYFDTDNDRLDDSYATYRDADGDGTYEDYEFSELGNNTEHDVRSSNVAQTTQQGLSGKAVKVSGTITEVKNVKRLREMSRLLKVEYGDGESLWVDMGGDRTMSLFEGDKFTAIGPIAKAGNKRVLMATTVEKLGLSRAITREGRKYSGTIDSTKVATVQGEKHTVAKLKTEGGKMMTVDMGVVDDSKKYQDGDQVDVTGVPVKLGDRVILIADKTTL